MRGSECPPEKIPSARYPCENPACVRQGGWRPEELSWSPGGADRHGTAWRPGFYCGTCRNNAPCSGSGKNAPTLAEEMARRTGRAGKRVGTANVVKLQLVGTLVCIPFDVEHEALLSVALADEDGKHEYWPWHLPLYYDWPESECLPCDFVSVEGQIDANGEGEPLMRVSSVRLLRQDIIGEQREQLLKCDDTVERWHRAGRLARRTRRR